MSHDNFPPPYEADPRQRRAGSVFDRISPAEPRPSQQQAQQPWTRPQPPPPMPQQPERRHENAPRAVPPRSRPQRREEEARNRLGPSHQQPRYEAEDYDSDEQQRNRASRGLPPPQRQRGRGPTSHLMDYQMNRSGNENSGQALATTTLNAVPTLAYEDVNPTADPHQIQAQQGPRRGGGRGRGRGFPPRNRSNPNLPGYGLHHRSYRHDTADCRDYGHCSRQEPARERHNSPQANRSPPRQDNRHGREAAAPRQRDVSPRRREQDTERPGEGRRHRRNREAKHPPLTSYIVDIALEETKYHPLSSPRKTRKEFITPTAMRWW
ncbi:basic salivary proline-rich protein 1-like [Olea europaea var. sylvestris]|uniref:basic salivary proline-rich protein 1-like n=1 Tax=Olea europaea var. sylvestris TaxID=158386 RepID=UPI000C1CEB6F|nr:basic salivary proline-rich protein 1-like [Olea europaea var. sylvestris]